MMFINGNNLCLRHEVSLNFDKNKGMSINSYNEIDHFSMKCFPLSSCNYFFTKLLRRLFIANRWLKE